MSGTSRPDDAPVDAVVHTPGPWVVYTWAEHTPRSGQPSTIGQGDDLGMDADDVCKILPIYWEDEQAAKATEWANARLIAAAPELLAALRSMNEVTNPLLDVDPMDLHRARVKAQNAIEAAAKVL